MSRSHQEGRRKDIPRPDRWRTHHTPLKTYVLGEDERVLGAVGTSPHGLGLRQMDEVSRSEVRGGPVCTPSGGRGLHSSPRSKMSKTELTVGQGPHGPGESMVGRPVKSLKFDV